MESLVKRLYQCDIIKFGEFTLKSGIKSNIYIDLRTCVSHPKLVQTISELIYRKAADLHFHHICGLPYTGIPFASYLSTKYEIPMLIARKERKEYGTKKMIEGQFNEGDTCLMLDDVITSGLSIQENLAVLNEAGLNVENVVVLVDRRLHHEPIDGIPVRSVLNLNELKEYHRLFRERVMTHYKRRQEEVDCDMAKKLLQIVMDKETNLALSADVTTKEELLELVASVGDQVCLVKTHMDIITDFDWGLIEQLEELAKKHNFMIMEDRKFADIGNTAVLQYQQGTHRIIEWADFVTVHGIMGEASVAALAGSMGDCGIFLLAQASSAGNLLDESYTTNMIYIGNETHVSGFIAQGALDPSRLTMTPGVKLNPGVDNRGQQYRIPETVIGCDGSDIMIVGRGIYQAADPAKAAELYRKRGWFALA